MGFEPTITDPESMGRVATPVGDLLDIEMTYTDRLLLVLL